MRRCTLTPRPDWKAKVESVGLTYHTHSGDKPYWDESVYYELTEPEVLKLEAVTKELHHLLIDVAQAAIDRGSTDLLGIPEASLRTVLDSWERDDFSVYGRFDFAWDGTGEPKLLEYNADTPTALVEAAVAQWYWLQDQFPKRDQFNSIHERLVEAWKRMASVSPSFQTVDFTGVDDSLEDAQTVSYLVDTAQQAGLKTRWTAIGQVGFSERSGQFHANNWLSSGLDCCFKLYPWEWLFREDFGVHLAGSSTRWIEPPWKALLSNKALLALAWELNQGHPNLLPTFLEPGPLGSTYVKKPILGREGANVTYVREGSAVVDTPGEYGAEGFVYQAVAPIAELAPGKRAILGSWVVDHESAGLGIRESDAWVTDNLSRFVPHCFG